MTKSDIIDIECMILSETTMAVNVDHGGDKACWLPKSQIEIELLGKGKATITLPQWLAEEKGIV